jgi:hypothetical protein
MMATIIDKSDPDKNKPTMFKMNNSEIVSFFVAAYSRHMSNSDLTK